MLVFYGAYEAVLKPIAEMGMIPNNEFRAYALPGTFETSETIVYNVIAVSVACSTFGTPFALLEYLHLGLGRTT